MKSVSNRKKFKSPPKRFQPRGLAVLYEDHDLLVVDKRSGLLTVSNAKDKENTAFYLLGDYLRRGNPKAKNRVYVVHRLDKDTSGILVFAKSDKVRRLLQEQWSDIKKTYMAVLCGHLREKQGLIESYLVENSIYKMYSVKDPAKGKLARTSYKVVKESEDYSLLEVDLLTGRKHQIRVHFAEQGNPVAGDKKYGTKDKGVKRLALHAASLTMRHPITGEEMSFKAKVPGFMYALVSGRG
jgi:tRNA pseudouridine32 synthase/23S rRNA pseudouridine746 synthase/23S rRNA pseudouridine1911/1915/1917 synthase